MRWSTELWDGFDRLTEYFHDGIDFYEKYEKFLKERCAIENTYAKSLRKLIKSYESVNQKKFIYKDQAISTDDLNKITYITSFSQTLNEIRDVAGQHELIAENIQKKVAEKVLILTKTFKDDRKKVIDERDRYYAAYQQSDDLLRKSKLKYEAAFKEAEKAKEMLNRVEQDDNSSRVDIRKQQNNYEQKLRQCDQLKADYANHLCDANKVKTKYYEEQLPSVLKTLQNLEEKRINSFRECLKESVAIESEVIPRIDRCLNEMQNAAQRISIENDIEIVVQLFKTGYTIPPDHIFEDLGEPNVPSLTSSNVNSSSNLSTSNGSQNGTLSSKTISFTSISSGSNGKTRDKKYGTLNPLKKMGFLKSKNEIEALYDLAPQQQKKELQKKIDTIKNDILKEQKEREGLMKLKEIYSTNQKFGDSQSALTALKQNEEKLSNLNQQLNKYQDLMQEVELNGGISKTTATLYKQKTLPRNSGSGSGDNGTLKMTRSSSQVSINSNNTSIPGTPISQHHNNSANLKANNNLTTLSPQSKYSENDQSFDDDDDEDINPQTNRHYSPSTPNGNYDKTHPKLQLTKEKQLSTDAQYEPIVEGVDSPPLTGNSVTHDLETSEFNEPIIGKALVIYEFKGTVQNAISIIENETLSVLERDSGDGWTLVKRDKTGEKGYVPTGYIKIEYF